jgi:serine protease Do
VGRGSPANQGGVSAGDVILEADKKPLKSWEELQHSVQNKKVGENIELSIGRNNEQGTVTVILGEATS